MAAVLQTAPRDVTGALDVVDGGTLPTHFSNGLPFDGPSLALDISGAINTYSQGIPFTAQGRIAATDSPPVYYSSGAAPYSGGRLCFGDSGVDHYSSDIPYTATSAIAAVGLDPNGVTITSQPQNWTGDEGQTAVFTYTAVSGNLSPITYIWEEETAPGVWTLVVDGGNISGATTDTLSISNVVLADNGRKFRGTATNDTNSRTTVVVTLFVNGSGETFLIITEAGDNTITEGGDDIVTEESP